MDFLKFCCRLCDLDFVHSDFKVIQHLRLTIAFKLVLSQSFQIWLLLCNPSIPSLGFFCCMTVKHHTSCGWREEEFWGKRSRSNVALCPQHFMSTIQTTVIIWSLSNITHKLCMTKRGILLVLGRRVKGQGQLWHFACETLWAQNRLVLV